MAREPADQRRPTTAQIATFKAAYPTMNTYVFTDGARVNYKSQVFTFRDGVGYALEPVFVTWLIANGFNPIQQ